MNESSIHMGGVPIISIMKISFTEYVIVICNFGVLERKSRASIKPFNNLKTKIT